MAFLMVQSCIFWSMSVAAAIQAIHAVACAHNQRVHIVCIATAVCYRFVVLVCSTGNAAYAQEAWRLLEMEGSGGFLIPPNLWQQRITNTARSAKKVLLNVLDGCNTGEAWLVGSRVMLIEPAADAAYCSNTAVDRQVHVSPVRTKQTPFTPQLPRNSAGLNRASELVDQA